MEQHAERFDRLVQPHILRRSHHIKDPVADFIFEYYSFRRSRLRRWTPGYGVALQGDGAARFLERNHFIRTQQGIVLSTEGLSKGFFAGTAWILQLLRATDEREAQFGCSGLHEWAMLYKNEGPRHAQLRLRVTPQLLEEVVEEGPLNCSHFDAFRFFTPAAQPLNARSLRREDMATCEQPGCLHANMDIYRWAFKRYPWIESELIMDSFELAMEIRRLDMAASPYDLTDAGLSPIRVELPEGRKTYARLQRAFSERAAVLRRRLIQKYTRLLKRDAELCGSFAITDLNS